MRSTTDVAIVGAGPCGLAAAIAMRSAGLGAIVFDAGCVVGAVAGYPTYMTFFSTAEKLAIGGLPFVVAAEKPTRRDALAYYRAVVQHFGLTVRQYERVLSVAPTAGGFLLCSRTRAGEEHATEARTVVIATGYFGTPNRLGVPGEELPHVTHIFREGHEAFQRNAVVVGGGNSAVEVAMEMWRAGARVTLVHFAPQLDRGVKPWVLPDITNRIAEGSIAVRWESRVRAIEPAAVVLESATGVERIPADHVYLMTGYTPASDLLHSLGVSVDPATGIPQHDPTTMETDVPGVFIAGVLAAGYDANKIFIENGRDHGARIAKVLTPGPSR